MKLLLLIYFRLLILIKLIYKFNQASKRLTDVLYLDIAENILEFADRGAFLQPLDAWIEKEGYACYLVERCQFVGWLNFGPNEIQFDLLDIGHKT